MLCGQRRGPATMDTAGMSRSEIRQVRAHSRCAACACAHAPAALLARVEGATGTPCRWYMRFPAAGSGSHRAVRNAVRGGHARLLAATVRVVCVVVLRNMLCALMLLPVPALRAAPRSWRWQLEKLQAMEAEKRKAEAPAPSSVAKKTTPARPAAAPATTPRATTGGKSMGLKGRAAAGGKSMGGKRPPQQPQSKKRKAGKKKKGDSSDSSSEESDSDSSSSSSSDDDQEEVAAKMPVKKRGKLTPATPKPDSGDESSDFEPEFDNNFFKSDDDRKWLMSLSEMDREQIITERREKQELQREAWQLEHSKRKAAARAGASAVKAKEAKEPATPGPSASVARGRASREGNKAVDKNADKRAALEDMEARKVEQQQKRLGARADVMEEDDDDAPRKRQEERQAMKPRHRQIPQEEKYPLMEPKELEAVRVSRDRLIEYAQSPFFGEFVQGMFVRVTLGKNAEGKQRYLVCVVIGVKDKQTEYNVYCPVTRKQVTLRKHLTVKHAGEKKAYPITVVSNKPFEESEVRKWCRDMHNDKEDLPEKAELEELRGKVAKNWKEAFVYDEDTVESILQEKVFSLVYLFSFRHRGEHPAGGVLTLIGLFCHANRPLLPRQ